MVQGSAILVVDLGNSSTKAKVLFGKDSKSGNYRSRTFELSNVFAQVPSDYEVSNDYNDHTSTILRVDADVNGIKLSGDYCNGELQKREFPRSIIKPSAVDKKWNLESSALSFRLALLHAYKAVMDISRVSDFRQVDVSWTVVTLLPPGDIDVGRDAITSMVKSITHIDSVYPEASLDVHINKVAVLPEGFCAYAGVVFDIGNVFRAETKFLSKEAVLVIDIGAGTTDICVIRGGKLVQSSKYTIPTGGNNVYQLVRRSLMKRGLLFEDSDIRDGVVSGTVKDGAKVVSIVTNVNEAKANVSQALVSSIQDFLELTDVQLRSIGYILICGGGAMVDSDVQEIHPLSESIFDRIRKYSPNCELVEIPTHTVTREQEDGGMVKVEETISPRELNLVGASILAEVI